MVSQRGFALILSAPSGTGKSTLVRHIMTERDDVCASVSTTTRGPRPGEVHGKDYFFVTKEEFQAKIAAGDFLEWAEVFGNYYGTDRAFIEQKIHEGQVILLDIDWQGARQITENLPKQDVVTAFVVPPSHDLLETRLRGRKSDSEEVIQKRMQAAAQEMSHWQEYDTIIINDDLEQAKKQLLALVMAECLRRERMQDRIRPILDTFDL
uniref:Guanylate kinase n=1 Tax=Magnetococcus massalia (strain MO-1) TaxID=451514 RepID=A0A1S7LPZ4_MAGMO|nr:Guanylate kinase (GMP kinase) [Candidatus Magnetococcus massalia]